MEQLLALDAVTVMVQGADRSFASAPAKVEAEAPEVTHSRARSAGHGRRHPNGGLCHSRIGSFHLGFRLQARRGEPNFFLVTGSQTDGAPVQSSIGSAVANDRGALMADVGIDAETEPGLYGIKVAGIRGTEATAPLLVVSGSGSDTCK